MLKRNLIPVAIISITLFLVGNASGQIPKKRITPKKSQISVMGVGGGVDDRRVGKNMGKKKYAPKIRRVQDVFVTERRARPNGTNIFLEGGNDSWNTRKKFTRKQKKNQKTSRQVRKTPRYNGGGTDHGWGGCQMIGTRCKSKN